MGDEEGGFKPHDLLPPPPPPSIYREHAHVCDDLYGTKV